MSYFVGGDVVEGGYKEDGGFAINGGKGWSDVVYDNHAIELCGNTAIAMGNYYFTCATTGGKTKVEYTFGYKRCADGKPRIFLHHSSVPYAVGKPAVVLPNPVKLFKSLPKVAQTIAIAAAGAVAAKYVAPALLKCAGAIAGAVATCVSTAWGMVPKFKIVVA